MKRNLNRLFSMALFVAALAGCDQEPASKPTVEEQGGDQNVLCQVFAAWCGNIWPNAHELFCEPTNPCHSEAMSALTCMYQKGICWPHNETLCATEGDVFQACMDQHSSCGDGFVSGNEDCEPGVGLEACTPDCKLDCGNGQPCAKCGDGVVEGIGIEECDDGNFVDGDGCSSSCQVEPELPLSCQTFIDQCGVQWGNGQLIICDPEDPCHHEELVMTDCMNFQEICSPYFEHACSDQADNLLACRAENA